MLAVAIILVFIFVPFGKNGDTQADDIDESDSVDMVSALTEQTSTTHTNEDSYNYNKCNADSYCNNGTGPDASDY